LVPATSDVYAIGVHDVLVDRVGVPVHRRKSPSHGGADRRRTGVVVEVHQALPVVGCCWHARETAEQTAYGIEFYVQSTCRRTKNWSRFAVTFQ
jgi:hypothetical protein